VACWTGKSAWRTCEGRAGRERLGQNENMKTLDTSDGSSYGNGMQHATVKHRLRKPKVTIRARLRNSLDMSIHSDESISNIPAGEASTTLADLLTPPLVANPFPAVRASLRR
jgi:hypothetical protein